MKTPEAGASKEDVSRVHEPRHYPDLDTLIDAKLLGLSSPRDILAMLRIHDSVTAMIRLPYLLRDA